MYRRLKQSYVRFRNIYAAHFQSANLIYYIIFYGFMRNIELFRAFRWQKLKVLKKNYHPTYIHTDQYFHTQQELILLL